MPSSLADTGSDRNGCGSYSGHVWISWTASAQSMRFRTHGAAFVLESLRVAVMRNHILKNVLLNIADMMMMYGVQSMYASYRSGPFLFMGHEGGVLFRSPYPTVHWK